MGILVAVVIAEVGHELGGRVAQMERHGQVARLPDEGQCGVDAQIGRVALGARGQIDGGLGQRYAALGPPYLRHRVEGRVGQQQGIGVGQSDVFGRTDHQPAGNEFRVLAPLYHACHPVECRIGVAAAYALDEGRDDVVVHLAVFVVGQRILLQPFLHQAVGDFHRGRVAAGLHHQLQNVEQLARVAATVAQQCVGLGETDVALAQFGVLGHGPVEQPEQVFFLQGLEHIELTAREQRAYHLEGGILGGGPDERHHALLHGPEQRVLLTFAEPVYLVDEKNGRQGVKKAVAAGPFDDLTHVFHAACHGAERVERCLEAVGDDLRQRGLPHSRRAPKDEGGDAPTLYHAAQHGPGAHEMLLPHVVVECAGTHSFG